MEGLLPTVVAEDRRAGRLRHSRHSVDKRFTGRPTTNERGAFLETPNIRNYPLYAVASAVTLRSKVLSKTSMDFFSVWDQPIEAVHYNELNLTLLGFEI